jgi:hypothetical protein
MNGTSSKGILADFYQKNFKNKQEMKEENGVENSESSSDEDFICGSFPSGIKSLDFSMDHLT